MDMDQRESIDGCLNYEGVPNYGCSQLYVGDIEIKYENVDAIQISHENKYEDLLAENEEPRSTSPSPLGGLQGVDQIQNEEEEEVHSHGPSFIEGSLKMSERDIQESLSILHDTQALVSNSCWRATSLEEPSSLEDMEKIQRAMCNIKYCQRVDCLEDHDKCENLNVLDVFEF